jgi:hypothetical protein
MASWFRRVGWKLAAALTLAVGGCWAVAFFSQPSASRVRPFRHAAEPSGPPWFADVTDEAGLDFVHDAGPVPQKGKGGAKGGYFMPQLMGSGAALIGCDPSGPRYLYLLQNGGTQGAKNRLYRVLPDGKLQDVTKNSGLDVAGYNMGVAVGDVNNDGLPDVLLTQYGGIKLFLNNGDGTFTDVTRESGLENPRWGCSAAFFDYDRDGWLDLVVVNYVHYDPAVDCKDHQERADYCGPNRFRGQGARLFRNRGLVSGPGGKSVLGKTGRPLKVPRFEDVTEEAGLTAVRGRGLGVVCADFDGDGWPDILVANDGEANHLWINQKDRTFKEEAVDRNLAFNRLGASEANMGITLGDVFGTGMFDVFITHVTDETNTLWRQGPRGFFEDHTPRAGLTRAHWRGTGFGTALADFNQDGALDLVIVNGRVTRPHQRPTGELGPHWSWYAERNQLFANDGSHGFRDISLQNEAFCRPLNVARGLVYGDLDGDGALDLLVTTVAGKARLYRNVAPNRGHWLLVRAVDPQRGGRDSYGAEVRVRAGRRRWLRLINPASSYLCSNDVRAHFGLGAVRRVDEIEVRWPDGTAETEVFPGEAVDRPIVLTRGTGSIRSDAGRPRPPRNAPAKPRKELPEK